MASNTRVTRLSLARLDGRDLPAPLLVAALPDGQVRIGAAYVTPYPDAPGVPVEVATDGDLVYVGAGPGGGPRVKTYSADGTPTGLDVFAFEESFRGGVKVGAAGGRWNAAPGPGGAPVVKTFDGPREVQSIYVGDPASRDGVADLAAYAPPGDTPIVAGNPAGTGTVFVDFETYAPRSYQTEVLAGLAELYAPVGWLRFTNRRPAAARAGDYGTLLVSNGPFVGYEREAAGFQADDWLAKGNRYQPRMNFVRPAPSAQQLLRTIAHEIGHALGLNHSDDPAEVMSPYASSGKKVFSPFQVAWLKAAQPEWLGGK